jgi:cyclic beta-1,2-glucan glucanotransferase
MIQPHTPEQLLQERTPGNIEEPRRFSSPHTVAPRTHLLSNGNYSVMLTAAGSGYSRWRDAAVTRWREDPTCDPWGSYVFLRDVATGEVWSAGYQPTGREPDSYEVAFFEDRAQYTRKDGSIVTVLDVLISPDEDAEVRRVSITNGGNGTLEIELTSYSEVVLLAPDADSAHPAFAKMFVQTEFIPASGTLLATRRNREAAEKPLWAVHTSVLEGEAVGGLQFETDRARFLGRGRDVRNAVSVRDARPLSNTSGTVLDPVLALRRRVRVAPGQTVRVAFWTLLAETHAQALSLAEKHHDPSAFDRAKKLARARAQARLSELGVGAGQAQQFQLLANQVLYSDASLRAGRDILDRNVLGPPALWAHAISGDLPIVLTRVDAETGLDLVQQVLLAQRYWHSKGLSVDIVILNEGSSASVESVQTAVRAAINASPPPSTGTSRPATNLEFFNGLGGFAAAGREYVTMVDEGHRTPAPWVNIVTNPHFGFQVSADGTGSTWSLNSREYQLTPWSNDPVSDTPAEVIYIRDDESRALWSATPLPIRQPAYSYTVHHGFGYTRFVNNSHGIAVDLLQFVPLEDAVKISRLKLVNRSKQTRMLTVANYLDWVLGNQRGRTAPFIVTEIEARTSALLARNPWRTEFQTRVAFLDLCGRQTSYTGDRAEFIGRHGSLAQPAAMGRIGALSNRVGGGLDSCGALQTQVTLRPGEEAELVFLLGDAESADAAATLIERYRRSDLEVVLKSVTDYWDQTLGAIQVKTPDRTMDILVNGWLLYQTLACRMWSRTGFYQASGAYGFRDQLQDSMALCVSRPALVREHILRAAARQFMAGDVQHWWLPTSGAGVKTRISDNRIWLPFVVAHYLEVTEDFGILDEEVHFLDGPPLAPDEHEIFASPPVTANTASLFEHCVLALNCSLAIGSHGLPLFGAGDWNDGMNRVGAAGRGESVWLGWFLYSTLLKFADVADRRGEAAQAEPWRKHAFTVQQAIEREAWDGDWYRRGYFDDGSPLGSISNDECRIDAIAQSWAVISGGGEAQRAARAMAAVESQLISRSDGLVKLFTPPFNRTAHDPGYIKAYPPGLRENGGQYTHAAMWTTLAFAVMGDGDRAGEILSLLNPINHAATRAGIYRYKVEPYVVCADVYSAESHVGRGGWTWYTGSAGWMYRTATEGILGIHLRGNILSIDPCIPRTWPGFEVTYKRGSSRYHIAVENPHSVCRGVVHCSLDGKEFSREQCDIELVDDGTYHHVRVRLG